MKNWWAEKSGDDDSAVLTRQDIEDAIGRIAEQSEQAPPIVFSVDDWKRMHGVGGLMGLLSDPETCEEVLKILVDARIDDESVEIAIEVIPDDFSNDNEGEG